MNFDEIITELNKYPFIEKMQICQEHSIKIMSLDHLEFVGIGNVIYPWELACFAELAILANKGPVTKSFQDNGINEFNKIINAIRNYCHPCLKSKTDNLSYAQSFIMATGLQQFKCQEDIIIRLFKYNYIFSFINSNINVEKIFSDEFGTAYSLFCEFAFTLFFMLSMNKCSPAIYKFIILKYIKLVNKIKMYREDYIVKQNEKNKNSNDNIYYGFNYLYPYPFIEETGFIFLPVPFLLIDAVTESLFTRLTCDDNRLRATIGKEVAQQYLYDILSDSATYDEVKFEYSYYIRKRKIDSPDVMIRKNNIFVLFDSKLSTPKISLKHFNEQDTQDTIIKYAENIIQLSKQIDNFGIHFNPFSVGVNDRSLVFGVVVLFEDSYIFKDLIYQKAFGILQIDRGSKKANFIQSNIKILGLNEIEKFALSSLNICESLVRNRDNPQAWNDITVFDEERLKAENSRSNIPLLEDFCQQMKQGLNNNISELVELGLIKKS